MAKIKKLMTHPVLLLSPWVFILATGLYHRFAPPVWDKSVQRITVDTRSERIVTSSTYRKTCGCPALHINYALVDVHTGKLYPLSGAEAISAERGAITTVRYSFSRPHALPPGTYRLRIVGVFRRLFMSAKDTAYSEPFIIN